MLTDDVKTVASGTEPIIRYYQPIRGWKENAVAGFYRTGIRYTVKPFLQPPWSFAVQRAALVCGAMYTFQDRRATVHQAQVGGRPVERIKPATGQPTRHAILYLHGGAFVAGSPRTHRSITRRLSWLTGAEVMVPDYKRAPEASYLEQIEECVAAYRHLLAEGYAADRISVAGDSAGGNLALMSVIAAMQKGLPAPACLVLLSPGFSLKPIPNGTAHLRDARDPMISLKWGDVVIPALNIPAGHPLGDPFVQDLSKLPPSLIQVGDDEVLYDNAVWIVNAATAAGRVSELEVYLKRWHVFQFHSGILASADQALERQAQFMKQHWAE